MHCALYLALCIKFSIVHYKFFIYHSSLIIMKAIKDKPFTVSEGEPEHPDDARILVLARQPWKCHACRRIHRARAASGFVSRLRRVVFRIAHARLHMQQERRLSARHDSSFGHIRLRWRNVSSSANTSVRRCTSIPLWMSPPVLQLLTPLPKQLTTILLPRLPPRPPIKPSPKL